MRRAAALLVSCAACGSGHSGAAPVVVPPAPSEPQPQVQPPPKLPRRTTIGPLAAATCIVKDGKGVLLPQVPLAVGRKTFAAFKNADSSELRATRDAATITIDQAGGTFTGDARLDMIALRPRTYEQRDGWLSVRKAVPKRVAGDAIEAGVFLPPLVEPATEITITYRCADVSLDNVHINLKAGRTVSIADRSVPLLLAPAGSPVAAIVPAARAKAERSAGLWLGFYREAHEERGAAGPPRDGVEIERRAGFVHVRLFASDVDVEGWIEAAAVGPPKPPPRTKIESFGVVALPYRPAPLVCAHDVTVHTREDGHVIDVGTFRAGAEIPRFSDETKDDVIIVEPGERWDDLVVALGESEVVHPFVDAAAVSDCHPAR
jgi:hypothetical protein